MRSEGSIKSLLYCKQNNIGQYKIVINNWTSRLAIRYKEYTTTFVSFCSFLQYTDVFCDVKVILTMVYNNETAWAMFSKFKRYCGSLNKNKSIVVQLI